MKRQKSSRCGEFEETNGIEGESSKKTVEFRDKQAQATNFTDNL